MWTNWLKKVAPDNWVLILIAFVVLSSCEEYQEGCMDAKASNFRASNQVHCCCEYPELVFQTTFTNNTSTVSYADTFVNSLGQEYLIRDFRLIVSGISLSDSLNRMYHPSDTFGQYGIPPDVMAVDVLELNSVGSNFMWNGQFDGIGFAIQSPSELDAIMPEDFPVDHPFRDSMFYDFDQGDWLAARVLIEVVDQDLLTIELTANELPLNIAMAGNWSKSLGNDLTVNFKINIETLFGHMDFSQPISDLRSVLATNLAASFEP